MMGQAGRLKGAADCRWHVLTALFRGCIPYALISVHWICLVRSSRSRLTRAVVNFVALPLSTPLSELHLGGLVFCAMEVRFS